MAYGCSDASDETGANAVTASRIVMIYIEPTPYIVALVNKLRPIWDGSIEVYYVRTDLSQAWNLQLDNQQGEILPAGYFANMQVIWLALTRDRRRTLLHLAGWGHPVLLGAMLTAVALRIPVAVESDTAEGRADGGWRAVFKRLLYPLLFRLPRRFLPGGTRQVRYLARFGVKPERMTVAQMTVDVCAIRRFCATDREGLRLAARARWGLAADARIVLYVGRLEAYKGIDVLLAAFFRFAEEEKSGRLVIAGDGSLRGRIEAIATNPGRGVVYLGRLAGDDVLCAFLAADLVVLPSLFEPWGLVVNEAMACGLPVIVSDRVGCADDLIRHGETGLVVDAGSATELASAIGQLAQDEPVRHRMGQAAERLISNWTLGNEARNIVSAWHEMI
jgi:glycosyltransferase involved in cell wall biosynthesis